MNKYDFWLALTIFIIIFLLAISIVISNSHLTIQFKMDDNTLEAVKSINWSALPK